MTAILTNNFRVQAAKDFLENLSGHPIVAPATEGSHTIDRNHYLFVGRSRPWPTVVSTDPQTSELSPPAPTNTTAEENALWDAVLGFKRIDSALTTLVIPRFDWDVTGNTIYKPYDSSDAELFDHPTEAEVTAAATAGNYTAGSFYVMTEDFHIFKCLSNNSGAKSTVKPTLPVASPYVVQTADGYRWKYLSTITPSQALFFLTDQWIPVKALGAIADDGSIQWDVEQAATDGTIDSFIIDNAGSQYTHVNSGNISTGGTNVTSAILATSAATLLGGASAVDGNYVGSTIFFTSGTGAGSSRVITGYTAASRTITWSGSLTVDATSVYEIWPTITISGDGSGATAKAKVHLTGANVQKISEIIILTAGSAYTYATASITGGGGTAAVARPVLPPYGGHGKNIEDELGAWNTMVVVNLAYNEGSGDFPLSNDYRQIGIVRNLLNYDGTLANAATRIGSKALTLGTVAVGGGSLSFLPDETITGTGGLAIGAVVEYVATTPTTGTLYYWQDSTTGQVAFADGMIVTGSISGATGTIQVGGVTNSEVRKRSGKIVYLENRRPILRAPDQQEAIKTVITF